MSQTTFGPKGALFPNTAIAGGAIVGKRAVKRGADQNTVVQATANAACLGIATDDQDTTGHTVSIADRPGEAVTAQAGAAYVLDALLASDATGRLVTATTGQNVVAKALEAATAADQLVAVKIHFQVAP